MNIDLITAEVHVEMIRAKWTAAGQVIAHVDPCAERYEELIRAFLDISVAIENFECRIASERRKQA